jgi:signal transduction histidine kinase
VLLAVGAAASVAGLGLALTPLIGVRASVPLAVTAAGAVWAAAPHGRPHIAMTAVVAGGASLAGTATYLAARTSTREAAGWAGLVEMAGLLVLVLLVARWGTGWRALVTGGITAGAAVVWILRFLPPVGMLEAVGACAVWLVAVGIAAGAGAYLRDRHRHRDRAVRDAQRAQRRQLARDLHDFVAHDLSGMLVQAQAAQAVAETDPGAAAEALRRIEAAGQRAMIAMDRSLALLAAGDDGAPVTAAPTHPGLEAIPDLIAEFTATGGPPVELCCEPAGDLPPEIGSAAYRIVVEALTNVRRHAPTAGSVHVRVGADAAALVVEVADVGGPRERAAVPPWRRGRRGTGLAGLGELARALGGELTAGATATGWTVAARLPLPERVR